MDSIPRGSYHAYVSRVKRGTHSLPPGKRETYTVPTVVNVGISRMEGTYHDRFFITAVGRA
jgi:hypothetical protein